MSESKIEEIISALWAIAAVCAFGYGFHVWGWLFAVKAALDTACSIYRAFKEIKSEREAHP